MKRFMFVLLMILAVLPPAISMAQSPMTPSEEIYAAANWKENIGKIPKDWQKKPEGIYVSKDGKVVFGIGHGQSRDLQISINKAIFNIRQMLIKVYGEESKVLSRNVSALYQQVAMDGDFYYSHVIAAVPIALLPALPDSVKLPVLK